MIFNCQSCINLNEINLLREHFIDILSKMQTNMIDNYDYNHTYFETSFSNLNIDKESLSAELKNNFLAKKEIVLQIIYINLLF